MGEEDVQAVLANWRYRRDECRRLWLEARERHGSRSPECRRALALVYGYRAAVQAAEAVLSGDTTEIHVT